MQQPDLDNVRASRTSPVKSNTQQERGATADLLVWRLTSREREVALLLAAGRKDEAIGRRLGIATSTVRTYVKRIQARLRLDDRRAIAVQLAAQTDALSPNARLP